MNNKISSCQPFFTPSNKITSKQIMAQMFKRCSRLEKTLGKKITT